MKLLPTFLSLTLTLLVAPACETNNRQRTDANAETRQASIGSSTSAPAEAASVVTPAHDPAHPPIDCPLRKQGIDPHGLKPFADVEKYIAFLEREDRALWQKPDAAVDSLRLTGAETVADLGAGSGYFSFRIAKALPEGNVVAIDIEPEMIRHIHHKAMTSGVDNIEVRLAKPNDPSVPPDADLVFICDVLHHVQSRSAWLKRLHTQVKPGAQVALIEFKQGPLPEGPPESLKMNKWAMIELMKNAGFELARENAGLLPYQHMLIFSRP